jgi:putative peptidoglycan lipid II flippase
MAEASVRGRLVQAALLLTVATVASRFLGYARDAMILAQFGMKRITDSYQAAFSVPDFFYIILVGGALSSAFIPVFGAYLATGKEEEAWHVGSSLFNLIFLLLVGVVAIGIIFAPQFVGLLVHGFDADSFALTVRLTRIMFIQTLFLGLAGIMIGVLNSYKRFTGNALSIVLYNIPVLLVGIYLFRHPELLANPSRSIAYYSIGVVAGALVSLMAQIPALLRVGLRYRPVLDLRHPGVRQFGRLVFPVLISQSVAYFNTFVVINLASGLPEGQLAASRLALRIMQIPLGLFAIAIGTAAFPTMTEQAAQGRIGDLRRTVVRSLTSTNFLTFPAAVGLIVLGLPIVRLFFEFGKVTSQDSVLTSIALFWYAFGIIGYSAETLLTRAFYALKDTLTPVLVSVGAILLNIVLSLLLIRPMGLAGLALAYSTAGVVNMLALLLILRMKIGHIGGTRILSSGIGSLACSIGMGIVCWFTMARLEALLGVATKTAQLAGVGVSIGVGVLVYFLLAYLLKMEEVQYTLDMLGGRLGLRRSRSAQ